MDPLAATAYLFILTNSANWSSTDQRVNRFPSMEACDMALKGMRTITTASQSGDKSGMIAVAFCSPSPDLDSAKAFYSNVPKDQRAWGK
jgi:hypothetical protein